MFFLLFFAVSSSNDDVDVNTTTARSVGVKQSDDQSFPYSYYSTSRCCIY